VRDIALFGVLPQMTILQPCNPEETRQALAFCVTQACESTMLRLLIGPSPSRIALPEGYRLSLGCGVALSDGTDAVLFAYGPIMLHEALRAAELLRPSGISVKVVNLPWLNRVDPAWLGSVIAGCERLYVMEDHAPVGGLSDHLLGVLVRTQQLDGRMFATLAVEGLPAWGAASEVLRFHGLDAASVARRLQQDCAAARAHPAVPQRVA
jgi:transketolase